MSKFGEFQHALRKSNADVAIVTETKITSTKFTPQEAAVPGYSGALRRDRSEFGGGIAVWIRNSLIYHHLELCDLPDHEVLWFTVKTTAQVRALVLMLLFLSTLTPAPSSGAEQGEKGERRQGGQGGQQARQGREGGGREGSD